MEQENETEEVNTEYVVDQKLAFLDSELSLSAERDIYDENEIYDLVEKLSELKINHPEITVPVIDWSRTRTYTGSEKIMSMLLDIRNIEYPYPSLQNEPETENATDT